MAELQTKSNSDGTHNPTENQPSQRQVMPVGPSGQWTKTYEKEVMLKEETTRLMQEREDLIADLEECKSELFKRIPPTQVSDDTIQQAIEQIRRAIDSFVFDSMGDAVDDALYDLFQKEQQLQKQKKRKSKNPLRNFIKKADISAWGPYDCSNFYILSVIIQWILDEYVFRKSYPMGITRDQIRCLEEVIKGMRHANQAQG